MSHYRRHWRCLLMLLRQDGLREGWMEWRIHRTILDNRGRPPSGAA